MSMSIAEAKSQFSAVLERAAAGEEITVTKHGRPFAKIGPTNQKTEADPRELLRQMRDLRDREGATLGDLTLKELREEGRKY